MTGFGPGVSVPSPLASITGGGFKAGPNPLFSYTDTHTKWIGDFVYIDEAEGETFRCLITRNLFLNQVGDPPDLGLRRAHGTYPDGPISQLQAGESIGNIYWQGLTAGLSWQGRSALIGCRTTEAIGPVNSGGELVFQTCTTGDPTSTDKMILGNDGQLRLLGDLKHEGTKLGFYNHATAARPTITGSRGGNAALASLLTGLDSLGLIVDNTSA